MLKKENRLYPTDSFLIAVMRSIFVYFMKKNGIWTKYITEIKRDDYNQAWVHPDTPVGFLGNASSMYEQYLEWDTFLRVNHDYVKHLIYNTDLR